MTQIKLGRYESAVLSFLRNAIADRGVTAETFIALPEEKRGANKLAKRGLVTIRKTDQKTAGFADWYVSATPAGLARIG